MRTVGGTTTDYRYGGDGWRLKKASGSNITYYFRGVGGSVLTEWTNPDATPTVPRDFIYMGGKLIAAVKRTLDVADGAPDAFAFTNESGAATSTLTYSDIATITGIVGHVATSISGGGAEYQVCSDAACASGSGFMTGASSIANGQYLRLRLTSSSAFSTATSTTMTVGTGNAEWSVTTGAQDTTPNGFSFDDQFNVATSTARDSNALAITGITGAVTTSISGSGASYRVCADATCAGVSFTSSSSTISNGQYLQLHMTSSSTMGSTVDTVMTVGTVSDTWSISTTAPDTTPDAFSFTAQSNLAKSQVAYSNVVQITGINAAAAIAISGGSGGYRVCADVNCTAQPAFTGSASTVVSGQYVQLRQWAASAYNTNASTTLTVGTASQGWTVSTTNDFPRMAGDWYTLNALCCWIGAAANDEVNAIGWGGGQWAAHQDGFFIYLDDGSGLVGELTADGQDLYWSDGSVWSRQPYEPQLQDGWYSPQYDASCFIEINGDGTAGAVWDEWGNRIFVRQSGPWIEVLWSSDWGVYDSGAIYWSDGRVWVR